MKSYKTYLFDVDGTLIDTTQMVYQCFLRTCKKYAGITVTKQKIFANIGIPLNNHFKLLMGQLSDEKEKEITAYHMDYQVSIFKEHLKIFDGVYEGLQRLKEKGKKLAVVTSRKRPTLELYLEYVDILKFFDVLISPESTKKHKPFPDPAIEAMSQLASLQEESIMIGDATFDIECGTVAGIDTAFVSWSKNDVKLFQTKPTYIINSMEDLF